MQGHGLGSGKRVNYTLIFVAHNGPGPWPCYFCAEPVALESVFTVHHLDHDHDNHDPPNLAAAHPGCHIGHHKRGRPNPGAAEFNRRTKRGVKHRADCNHCASLRRVAP